ncbi:hypothetical protein C4J81_08765 [Deltaproteobacteria bacterium Smac51]|nr:hypothetical protein C4J81_08765 [Deltaproteobacteria bacterium Smac51]
MKMQGGVFLRPGKAIFHPRPVRKANADGRAKGAELSKDGGSQDCWSTEGPSKQTEPGKVRNIIRYPADTSWESARIQPQTLKISIQYFNAPLRR